MPLTEPGFSHAVGYHASAARSRLCRINHFLFGGMELAEGNLICCHCFLFESLLRALHHATSRKLRRGSINLTSRIVDKSAAGGGKSFGSNVESVALAQAVYSCSPSIISIQLNNLRPAALGVHMAVN
jgi:hypothetical protein